MALDRGKITLSGSRLVVAIGRGAVAAEAEDHLVDVREAQPRDRLPMAQ